MTARWWDQSFAEPLIDLYTDEHSTIWLVLMPDMTFERVCFTDPAEIPCTHYIEGEPPAYVEATFDGLGWHDVLDVPKDDSGTLDWALENGIVPCQPFAVRVFPPRVWRGWTDYGYEYDMETRVEVLRVRPAPPGWVASQLELWLEERA